MEYGKFYHIYNLGYRKKKIFLDDEDYSKFLELYKIFIKPLTDTYAWCLIPNHFHFLIRINEENEIGFYNPKHSNSEDLSIKWKLTNEPNNMKADPANHFHHLFNAYGRYYNLKYMTKGRVFKIRYKRKLVEENENLPTIITYINNNPIKHKIVSDLIDYQWTSYHDLLNNNNEILTLSEIERIFQDKENFIFVHQQRFEKLFQKDL